MQLTSLNYLSIGRLSKRPALLACLLIGLVLLTGTAQAQYVHNYSFPTLSQVGFRLTEPGTYDQTYHVKKTGNDDNAGTSDAPLLTLGKAIEKAKASLKDGQKTKILIYPGTYQESVKEISWNNNDNTTKRTLLCIEGQNAGGSVILKPKSDTHEALFLDRKHSVIIRNIIFDGAYQNSDIRAGGALLVSGENWYFLFERLQDWLVENCEFKNSNGTGIAFHHNEYSTFRNITVKDNKGGGGSVALRYCLMEGLTLTGNNESDLAGFSNGGLFWISVNTILRNSNLSSNKGAGLRMDHSCVNSVFENITADSNRDQGLVFETATGPILLKNCTARNNKIGLGLLTVYDVVVDGCTFSDNTQTQIEFALMKRDDPSLCVSPGWYCTSSDYNTAVEKSEGNNWTNSVGMTSNRRIEVRNTTLTTTKGTTSYLYQFAVTDRGSEYNGPFISGNFWGSNNKYYNKDNDNVFGLEPTIYTDFEGWKAATGEESGSIWGTGGAVPSAATLATPTVNGANSVTLNWADNSNNETGFRLQRRRGGSGVFTTIATLSSGTTSYTNTGLTAATQYSYRVKAVNDEGTTTSNEVSVTTSAASAAGDIVFATNSGGGLVVGSDGTSYEADYNFSGGSTYTWSGAYENTSDDELYGPERYGTNFSYKVPLPKGSYEVTFKFADTKTTVGDRIFNVYAEDFAVLSNLDIYAKAGASYKAYDVTKRITITDDTMKLTFKGTNSADGSATVKGLLIKKSACTDCAVVIDSLKDWSKTYSHTSWYIDNTSAVRNATTTESIVYNYNTIEGFSAVFSYHTTFPVTITFYSSADNITYNAIASEYISYETSGGWYRREYTPTAAIPNGTNFLKIEVSGGDQAWTPALSEVQIQYRGISQTAFSGDYKIIAKHSGKVLDVDQQSQDNGAIVQQYGYNGGNNQQWTLESVGDGYYKIIAKHSGKVLDVSQASTDNGVNVRQWEYTGGDNQKWKLESVSSTNARTLAKRLEAVAQVRLSPNPATSGFTVSIPATEKQSAQVVVYSPTGGVLQQSAHALQAGDNQLHFSTSQMSNGLHLLKVQAGTQMHTLKVVVVK